MDITDFVQTVAIYALPVLFAITLHEAAHGYVARHFGDMTAYAQGRISLNPVRHIDPVGTIVVPLAILLLSGGRLPMFGWAKPVPVNYSALRHPKQQMAWVAAAGPAANLAMVVGWAVLLKIAMALPTNYFTSPIHLMSEVGIRVNLVFMFLNLLPIPPLDGGRIVTGLLPHRLAWRYARLEAWGLFIVIALLVTGVFNAALMPLLRFSNALIRALVL
jgi:Zn-dependent protease